MLKKNRKKTAGVMSAFALVFSLAALLICGAVGGSGSVAYASTSNSEVTYVGEDGVTYTFDTSTGTITNASITSSTDVVIPSEIDGVEVVAIDYGGFDANEYVLSVTFPSSVKTIADYTFKECENLTTVIFETSEETVTDEDGNETTVLNGIASIGQGVFSSCPSLTSVTLPDSLEEVGNYTFLECTSLEEIVIPDNVTYIGEQAFVHDTSLKSVTLGESLVSIDLYAFNECSSLAELVIPDSVTTIGYGAFANCSSLASLELGSSVEVIDDWAFVNCTSLTELVLPDSVSSVGYGSFQSCTSLKTLELGLTTISEHAFAYCFSLEELVLQDSVETIGAYAFDSAYPLVTLELNEGLTTIGDYAFDWCASLEEVVLPDSVETIGDYAFYHCWLETIELNEGLTSIGDYAFAYEDENIDGILAEAWIYSTDVEFGTNVFAGATDDFTIYGYAGSTAEAYAEEYSYNFVAIESLSRDLTVTVRDSEGNTITDGYTVTWYDADGTVLLEGDTTLSDADASQSYIVEITLGSDLQESYEQPEQCEIAPEDEADCVITLSAIEGTSDEEETTAASSAAETDADSSTEETAAASSTDETTDISDESTSETTTQLIAASDADGSAIAIYTSEEEAEGDAYLVVTDPDETVSLDLADEDVAALIADMTESEVEIAEMIEVYAVGDVPFPITLTFSVDGVTADNFVALLHYMDGAWQAEDATVDANGYVTATFTSLSPLAFIVTSTDSEDSEENATTAVASTGSEDSKESTTTAAAKTTTAAVASTGNENTNTGDTSTIFYVLCIIGAAAAMLALSKKKVME